MAKQYKIDMKLLSQVIIIGLLVGIILYIIGFTFVLRKMENHLQKISSDSSFIKDYCLE